MIMRLSFITVILLLNSIMVQGAEQLLLRTEEKESSHFIIVSAEAAQLLLTSGNIQGLGASLEFKHSFSEKLSMGASFSQAFSMSGGFSAVYTSICGMGNYALLGRSKGWQRRVFVNDQFVYSESTQKEKELTVGLGVIQLFLNGTTSIYPASGFVVGSTYSFEWLQNKIRPGIRYGQLLSQGKSVSTFFLQLGFELNI